MKAHHVKKITNPKIKDLVLSLLLLFSISLVYGYDNGDEDCGLDTMSNLISVDESCDEDTAENFFDIDSNVIYGPMTAEEAGYVEIQTTFDSSLDNMAFETFQAGTLIIPMDNNLQSVGSDFNILAYGLIVRLLHADVPVKWAINSSKSKDGVDFTANSRKILPSSGGTSNTSFRAGPFVVFPGYEAAATAVINSYNSSLSGTSRIDVYRLETSTSIEIRNTLVHKPKVAILNNGNEQAIHTNIFIGAGLQSGVHYVTDLNASDLDGSSCVTLATEPHADSVNSGDVIGVRTFLESGGNFVSQCASIRRYEGSGTNQRLITNSGLNGEDNGRDGLIFDNASYPIIQFQGSLSNEGGSISNFTINSGNIQSGASTRRHVYYNNSGSNFKLYGGKVANVGTPNGGMVYYLGGHKYTSSGVADTNGERIVLNAMLIPPTRPSICGLTVSCFDLAVTVSKTDVLCVGVPTGTATANVTGGSSPFTYSWSNGGTTQTITNLSNRNLYSYGNGCKPVYGNQ